MFGPPDEWGDYTWDGARQAGMEVDIDRQFKSYPLADTGPQYREVHEYLTGLSCTKNQSQGFDAGCPPTEPHLQ
jgi:hypothetical protein